jgi:DNA-directed RNA polymerase III subunit RPC6
MRTQSPTKKFYMLHEVEPSVELTGGAWYTDDELDVEFIDQLASQLHRYIASRSRPKSPTAILPSAYAHYPTLSSVCAWLRSSQITTVELAPGDVQSLLDRLVYDGKVSKRLSFGAAGAHSTALTSGRGGRANAVQEEEDDDDDDYGEHVSGDPVDQWVYIACKPEGLTAEPAPAVANAAATVPASGNTWTNIPCGRCPVFSFCKEGGPISPTNCSYYQRWLEF